LASGAVQPLEKGEHPVFVGPNNRQENVRARRAFRELGSANETVSSATMPWMISAPPKRLCEFALNRPPRQANIPQVTILEPSQRVPILDPRTPDFD
jgi:hypothetical protein